MTLLIKGGKINKTKKMTFTAVDTYHDEVAIKPFPATQAIPEWWKKMTPYLAVPEQVKKGNFFLGRNSIPNTSFKKCTPMLDALASGYIIPLWTDVFVTCNPEGFPVITWKTLGGRGVFAQHGDNAMDVETPLGYSNLVFKYLNPWIPKTPRGYSILVTQPFGYRQTAFQAVPAIIDSDKSTLEVLPPMWVKEGFEGVVEKGTPLVQITPFKRNNWELEFNRLEDGEYQKIEDRNFNSTLINHYLKNVWSKKSYK